MKFIIDQKIFENYPELNMGIIIARNISNKGKKPEISELIKNEERRINNTYTTDKLLEEQKILVWRNVYKTMGAKPKKHRSSVESLYRMILKGINLRHINTIVDLYNYSSIKYMIPAGGDDLDKVDGDIILRYAEGTEPFTALNTSEVSNPRVGEIIYADDKEVLCRRWNWRECDKTKMTEETKNVALVIEGMPPFTENDVKSITNELAELVQEYCGGESKLFALDKNKKEIKI